MAIETCANCDNSASLRCSCPTDTYYCNTACQKTHWPTHKKACKEAELDRVIHRAGQLLQDVFFVFCRETYSDNLIRVEDKGAELFLYDGPMQPGRFFRFPDHLVPNEADKKMVLSTMMCAEALAYFHNFLNELLEGTRTEIYELSVKVKTPSRRTRVVAVKGPMIGEWRDHQVIMVAKHDLSKNWVLDPTGMQYSISASAMDMKSYYERFIEEVYDEREWGSCQGRLEEAKKWKGNGGLMARICWAAVRVLEDAVVSWKAGTGLTMKTLLRQPEPNFGKSRKLLIHGIKEALQDFVTTADFEADILETERYERGGTASSFLNCMGVSGYAE